MFLPRMVCDVCCNQSDCIRKRATSTSLLRYLVWKDWNQAPKANSQQIHNRKKWNTIRNQPKMYGQGILFAFHFCILRWCALHLQFNKEKFIINNLMNKGSATRVLWFKFSYFRFTVCCCYAQSCVCNNEFLSLTHCIFLWNFSISSGVSLVC